MITSRNSKKYTNVLDHVPLESDLKKQQMATKLHKWPNSAPK